MKTHRYALWIWLALAMGCGPKPTPLPNDFDPTAGPVIPAMEAPMYATGHALPKDPLTAQVALGLRWSEALSGAAATVGLELEAQPTLEAAQHAAHRAGYPYPVKSLSIGWVPVGEYPEELAEALRRTMREGDDIGLTRVRTLGKDRWVALVAHPNGYLQPIRREMRKGAEVPLKTAAPARWSLISPTGRLTTGTTPASPALDEQGEWWLHLRGLNATLVSVPLYVDIATPPTSVLELPGESVTGPGDAVALTLDLLAEVRHAFRVPGLTEDGTLTTLAQYPLEQVLDDSWTLEVGVERLQGAGFVGGPVTQVHCTAPTVATCLDRLLSEPTGRSALLNNGYRLIGAAAQARTDGVTVLLNLASQ